MPDCHMLWHQASLHPLGQSKEYYYQIYLLHMDLMSQKDITMINVIFQCGGVSVDKLLLNHPYFLDFMQLTA